MKIKNEKARTINSLSLNIGYETEKFCEALFEKEGLSAIIQIRDIFDEFYTADDYKSMYEMFIKNYEILLAAGYIKERGGIVEYLLKIAKTSELIKKMATVVFCKVQDNIDILEQRYIHCISI